MEHVYEHRSEYGKGKIAASLIARAMRMERVGIVCTKVNEPRLITQFLHVKKKGLAKSKLSLG